VLLGILEPHETVILSTHLIEEVSDFIGRAVLIRKGEIVGDISMAELGEQGTDLMTYIKSTYSYKTDRIIQTLNRITDEDK